MNNLQPSPIGIDYYIQQAQTYLYDVLLNKWGSVGIPESQFQFFGRVYKNWRSDGDNAGGYIPEVFIGGADYDEVFHNDKLSALMWFAVNDPIVNTGMLSTYNVSIYGFVNLDYIKPSATGVYRDDMSVLNDVTSLINNKYGFEFTGAVLDVDSVLSHYTGSRSKQGIKDFNMHPKMCFRIDLKIVINTLVPASCGISNNNQPSTPNMLTSMMLRFKDVPDPTKMQRVKTGTTSYIEVQLEYPSSPSVDVDGNPIAGGGIVVVPALYGRTVMPVVWMDNNSYQSPPMPYNSTTQTYDNSANGGFLDGSVMTVYFNLN